MTRRDLRSHPVKAPRRAQHRPTRFPAAEDGELAGVFSDSTCPAALSNRRRQVRAQRQSSTSTIPRGAVSSLPASRHGPCSRTARCCRSGAGARARHVARPVLAGVGKSHKDVRWRRLFFGGKYAILVSKYITYLPMLTRRGCYCFFTSSVAFRTVRRPSARRGEAPAPPHDGAA